MNKAFLIPLFLLAACGDKESGLGRIPTIPDLPPELNKKAEKLPPITDNSMGGLVIDGTNTDIKYNEVSTRLNTVLDIYECVKTSFNNKKSPDECFK